jgi:O-antigen/teichoic acid export membrane protein
MSVVESSLKSIAKGAGFMFAGMILSKLFGYLYRVVVARVAGSEGYGLISLGMAVVSLAVVAALLGLADGVVRYVSFFLGKKDEARAKNTVRFSLKTAAASSVVIAIALYLSSDFLATGFFNQPSFSPVLKAMSLAIPFIALLTIIVVTMQALHAAKHFVLIRHILETGSRLLLTALALFLGFQLLGAALAYSIAAAVSFALAFYWMEKKIFPVLSGVKRIPVGKEVLSYSLPLLFGGILWTLLGWTDTLLMGVFRTASEVGAYNVAVPTASLLLVAPQTLLFLFAPVIAGLFAQNLSKELEKVYKTATKWVFFFNLPILCLMLFYAKQIVLLFFGPEYVSPQLNAALPLQILSIGSFLYSVMLSSDSMLRAFKYPVVSFTNILAATTVDIVLNLFLIPRYGIVGGAVSTATAFALFGLLSVARMRSRGRMQPFGAYVVKSVAAALVSLALLFIVHSFISINLRTMILFGIAFLAVYAGILFLLKAFSKEDYAILRAVKARVKAAVPSIQE